MGEAGTRAAFARGFWILAPLWLGVVPFGLAYAVTARSAGLSLLETQALSTFVFAGSAQLSAVGLFAAGAAGLEIVLTTLLLNVRHVLYGLSLGRELSLTDRQRPVAAFFLTDEAFGVVSAARERSFVFLLGAELSLFMMWNLATFGGFLLGAAIPDPERARRRPDLPTRLPGAPRAARADARGTGRRARCGRPRVRPGANPVGRSADPAHRCGREPPRRGPDARRAGREPRSSRRRCSRGRVTFWLTLAGMVAVTFGSRYAGLAFQADLPAFWVRFLHFVPIAVFAALVTPSLEGSRNEWGIRVAAAGRRCRGRVADPAALGRDRGRDDRVLAPADPVLAEAENELGVVGHLGARMRPRTEGCFCQSHAA